MLAEEADGEESADRVEGAEEPQEMVGRGREKR
jgi:hypothetical protein